MKENYSKLLVWGLTFYALFFGFDAMYGQKKALHSDLKDPQNLSSFIDSIITSEMEKEQLPAVTFALVHKKKVLIKKAYGVKNVDEGMSVDFDKTLFRVGSISKVFTCIALTQLVDKGLVNLDDDVNQYLEEDLKLDENYPEGVKIWHLLTHTSGFDQKLRGRLFDNKDIRPSIREFLKGELVRIRPPGEMTTYDTYGITLAGRIIENVSGLSFQDYLRQHLFEPIGMTNSWVEVPDDFKENLAIGYGLKNKEYVPLKYELYTTTPASSIDASTTDMTKFIRAILGDGSVKGGRILSKKMAKQIKEPQFRIHPDYPGFTYGFWEDLSYEQRAIWHGGIMNGYTSSMYLFPELELGFYFVYTRDFETGPNPRLRHILQKKLLDRWFNKKVYPTDNIIKIDTKRFEGTYANILYCHHCFEGEGASRRIHSMESIGEGSLKFLGTNFHAISPLEFVDEPGTHKIIFKENEEGEITHVIGNFGSDAVYEKLGEPLLKASLGKDYSSQKASSLKAMTYRGMRDWQKAAMEYEKITKIRPSDGRAFHYLGFCLKNQDKPEEAINAFTKSYDLGLWKGYNANYIAEIHALSGNSEETYQWIGKMIALGKEAGDSADEIKGFIFRNPALKKFEDDPRILEMLKD